MCQIEHSNFTPIYSFYNPIILIICTISSNLQPNHKALNKNLHLRMKAFIVMDIHWIGASTLQFLLVVQMFGQLPLYLLQMDWLHKSKCFLKVKQQSCEFYKREIPNKNKNFRIKKLTALSWIILESLDPKPILMNLQV